MELILVFSVRFVFKNPDKQESTHGEIHCSLDNSPCVRLSSFVTQAPLILECFLKRWLMALIDSFIAQFYPELSLFGTLELPGFSPITLHKFCLYKQHE